jgi:hypothetical protein
MAMIITMVPVGIATTPVEFGYVSDDRPRQLGGILMTAFNYDYEFSGGQPASGKCFQTQSSPGLVAFNYTDADSNNNTAFLQAVAIGDQITCNGVTWTVDSITPKGSNVQFAVIPAVIAPPTGVTSIDFEHGQDNSITVTKEDGGTTVATNGILLSIYFKTPPSDYNDWFWLVDDSQQPEVTLYCVHIGSSGFPSQSYLLQGGNIPFGNLTVKSISAGSEYTLEVV